MDCATELILYFMNPGYVFCKDATEVQSKYAGVSEQVVDKHAATEAAHQRAKDLLDRASNLATNLPSSFISLQSMIIYLYLISTYDHNIVSIVSLNLCAVGGMPLDNRGRLLFGILSPLPGCCKL